MGKQKTVGDELLTTKKKDEIISSIEWIRLKNAYARVRSIIAEMEEIKVRQKSLRRQRQKIGDFIVEAKRGLMDKLQIAGPTLDSMLDECYGAPYFDTIRIITSKSDRKNTTEKRRKNAERNQNSE